MVVYQITKMEWALIVAVSVGLLGIVSTFLSDLIDMLWMKLARVLGMIMPNILLTIIFYLFLFPIAALSRLFGKKDPLFLKNRTKTLWVDSNRTFDQAYFEKTW